MTQLSRSSEQLPQKCRFYFKRTQQPADFHPSLMFLDTFAVLIYFLVWDPVSSQLSFVIDRLFVLTSGIRLAINFIVVRWAVVWNGSHLIFLPFVWGFLFLIFRYLFGSYPHLPVWVRVNSRRFVTGVWILYLVRDLGFYSGFYVLAPDVYLSVY